MMDCGNENQPGRDQREGKKSAIVILQASNENLNLGHWHWECKDRLEAHQGGCISYLLLNNKLLQHLKPKTTTNYLSKFLWGDNLDGVHLNDFYYVLTGVTPAFVNN